MRHVEGAPLGTRGGLSVLHVFPADGEYQFKIMLHMGPTGDLFGGPYRGEQIEVSIDGERVALMDINPRMNEQDPNGMTMQTPKVDIKAGQHRMSAVFVQRFDGPADDLIMPIEHTLADTNIGEVFGTTALTHLRDFTVSGPLARDRRVGDGKPPQDLYLPPHGAPEESACAADIVRKLASQAYRGPVARRRLQGLDVVLRARPEAGGLRGRYPPCGAGDPRQPALPVPHRADAVDAEGGADLPHQRLRSGVAAVVLPVGLDAGCGVAEGGISGHAAHAGGVRQAAEAAADRSSDRKRSRPGSARSGCACRTSTRFAPITTCIRYWDTTLSQAMVRETELFVDSLIREDRPVTDLLTADHTFVNERLAKHYGIPNILGDEFRRVTIADPNRRGVLGQGSVLLLTSIADRTSPVLRGKWVMEVLLGSPPPPPPPNVPLLEETKAVEDGKTLSTRERMEKHRKNPACSSCHRVIDPLGLALENFDVTGVWRIRDNGVNVDPVGDLYDGTKLDGPIALRNALMKHQDVFMLSFTESLMTYALGRRVEVLRHAGDPADRA